MTLFLRNLENTRRFEISDAYIMALSFIISYYVGVITKAVILKLTEQQEKKSDKKTQVPNPRGGTNLQLNDNNDLAATILSCIADNHTYSVKNQKLKELIFKLVKAKIKQESLVLTPNMIRLLATNLINSDQTFITKVGNYIASSDNRVRINARVIGGAILGLGAALTNMFPYFVVMAMLYFSETENMGYTCSDYFDSLPQDNPVVKVLGDTPNGHLVIMKNEPNRDLEFYTLAPKTTRQIATTYNGESAIRQEHQFKRSRKKAKQVNFSDFRKTDPVLSKYDNIKEPYIPQTKSFPDFDLDSMID